MIRLISIISFSHEGKIEIVFEKVLPELWSNFGIFERTRTKDEMLFSDYSVVSRNFFNRDSFELVLKAKTERIIAVPIGYHLNLRANVSGEFLIALNLITWYIHLEKPFAFSKPP